MKNIFGNFGSFGKVKTQSDDYMYILEPEEGTSPLEQEKDKKNLLPFFAICLVIFLALTGRLLQLQISQGLANRYLAEGNRIRFKIISAPRGEILDSKGKILASNHPAYNLEIYPTDLPSDKQQRLQFYQEISQITQIPIDDLKKAESEKEKLQPYILRENLDRDTAMLWEVQLKNLPVTITKTPQRYYYNLPTLSHFIGYVGKITEEQLEQNNEYNFQSVVGQTGLEKSYKNQLKGTDGRQGLEVNAKGQIKRTLTTIPAVTGSSLMLSVDLDLQKFITDDLQKALDELGIQQGVVVAANPKTGEILSMVSLPAFDNNLFVTSGNNEQITKIMSDQNKPLINRATSGVYPFGSTIKPFIASAGLQEKIITTSTTIQDPGEIRVGQWVFPDWKVHGTVDVYKAIAESCNVFFYSVGGGWQNIKGLGIDKIKQYLTYFGFGSKTGIDIPSDAEGLVPSPDWKKKVKNESWYIGDTYHVSIGQGDVLVTPLQLLNGVSAIANGGSLLKPHFVWKILDKDGKVLQEFQREVVRENFVSKENIEVVREGMHQATTEGSARQLGNLPVAVAAKTGTAQFGNEGKTHAWITAFAPFEDPQIAIVVLVEGGGEGNSTAQPIAKDILQYYFSR
ncbi:MAG: penicillin-binding protein 2 [Candidatus Nealsonbacteria bacterium CG23_combo_of_CG06-09_8_20_14_all_40_13]|uniref:Penicillin-binding protein 2 n=1 Tax=Candidatus Nealsonbacteria bacterium CG23_combo_of_CG06-09_8_20_14_all_40_13 TaxID=1974724 RepID=A0A2G9YQI6_9BACT|nr:MAG: penicillin-binding protein 2 [Candidatus Nealsonbacteria bacterium CG23_combo_of_CG06-09_8_20_14_all_40_13]PIR70960.1 MAG: penicillin-binding protein 2 [Candidatus Nealsonbacteria bacterium CG10_big_fil_rev_8_21_14_0_10_40_24]PIU43292.1 MAG: penicillin-binding protein 2 [Candidatus Nealsonbacteria bacterium CG07_land_8_20_14_0_80_40_10]